MITILKYCPLRIKLYTRLAGFFYKNQMLGELKIAGPKLVANTAIGLALFLSSQAIGQLSRTDGMLDVSNDMKHTLVQQIPFGLIKTEGTYYYSDEWKDGEIELNNGTAINGFKLKYDIENNELMLMINNDVKFLDGSKVNRFTLVEGNSYLNFISAQKFNIENTPLVGFFQILVNGKRTLLSKWSTSLKKATYNAAIDMGTEENKIIKVERLYLSEEGRLNRLTKNKKKTLALFGNSKETINQYAKENGLGFKKKEDLQKVVSYCNSL